MKTVPNLVLVGVLLFVAACGADGSEEEPDGPPVANPGAGGTSVNPGASNPASTPIDLPPASSPLGGLLGGSGAPASGGVIAGLGGLTGGFVGGGGRPVRLAQLRTAATPPPTISGGSLAVTSDGKQIVAADPDRDMVYLIDASTLAVRRISLAPGSEPGRVSLDRSGGAHVALRGSGKLVRVDLANASVAAETSVCRHPRGVAFDAKNNVVAVSCMDGQLVSLDPVSHRESARLTLQTDLRDVVVNDAGARWIARYRSAELLTFSGSSVKSVTRPAQARRTGFVGGELAFDLIVGPSEGPAMVPVAPQSDTVSLSPALAWRAFASQRGGAWMLHQLSQDDEVVITTGGYGGGCQTITSGAITEFAADGAPVRTLPILLRGLSVDAAISPDEKWLAVASPGAFALSQGTLQLYATTNAVGSDGLPSPMPSQLPCNAPVAETGSENQIVAVAFDATGLLYALSREPAELQIYELQVVGSSGPFTLTQVVPMRRVTIALDTRSMRDTGHDLFHADVGQGLACASCHGEVLEDGHVWNFQNVGPRRTQNLRGGLLTTTPFHWDGDMMSMGHLVDEVMTGRMGGFPVELSFATALGQWLEQQPALTLPALDAAAVARGKELFDAEQTACSTCHSGKNLTNNESWDVGTGGKFQVPGLLGLGLRPPYMHNGCAKTLLERFDPNCGGGDAHGKTSQLSAAQRLDLVAYLSTL